METNEPIEKECNLIDIIPYLFLVLESIETQFLLDANKSQFTSSTQTTSSTESTDSISNTDCLKLESLCVNSLLSIYKLNKLYNNKKLDSAKFNIELLMQILQTKPDDDEENAREDTRLDRLNLQQNILILLSEIASIFPDRVLEHVLIMFVFVGNKLARKDDSYSFQIINQIIKSILPSIVSSCIEEQQQNYNSQGTLTY
jgi:hypothetical protein